MKKLLVLLLVLVLGFSLFASNLHFVFGDLSQHPDILYGFAPSYVLLGVGYNLPELIEGNTTDIRLLVGEGYSQRLMWRNEDTGANMYGTWNNDTALRFNVWQNEMSLRFVQGFLKSSVDDKDLFTLTLYLNGRYERYYSSSSFLFMNFKGTLDEVIEEDYNGGIYPELNGRKDFLGLEFAASLKFDIMKDTIHTNDGLWSRIDVKFAPALLNKSGAGHAEYYSIVSNTVGAKTLYSYTSDTGKSLFSIALVDRVNASYTSGDAVPSFIQGPVSLGRKVRGFNTYTYGTQFSVVNNLDLRFAGPDLGINGIAPRINLFLDCGYGWGKVFNTNISEKNFLASVGVQVTMCFFDFIDLGYEVNYLLVDKDKYTQSGKKITTNFTFFLDF